MKHRNSLAGCCLAVLVMFLLSVSVHPAMAAEAINKEFGDCLTCGGGTYDLSSLPGFENKKVPTVNIREISPDSSFAKSPGLMNSRTATVAGTQKIRQGFATLDIQDPRSLQADGARSATVQSVVPASSPVSTGDPVAGAIANLTSEGYNLTATSTHRYLSTLISDDFLALNSSQMAALASEGFVSTAPDTVVSYRDVTYHTFINSSTHATRYMMVIQRIDAGGNSIGEREVAVSPVVSSGGARLLMAQDSGSGPGWWCWWKWVVVILCFIGLIANIALIIIILNGATAGYAAMIIDTIGTAIAHIFIVANTVEFRPWLSFFYYSVIVIAIISALLMLIALAYSIYDLGVCMGWWDPLFGDNKVWTYTYRFNETDNGKEVQVSLHERFALTLFADTRADPDAKWQIVSQTEGLKIQDQMTITNVNGTIQSWLVEVQSPGLQEFVLDYMTSKPVPETVPISRFALAITGTGGEGNIATADKVAKDSAAVGRYSSLAVDRAASSRISYYNAAKGHIISAVRTGDTLNPEAVTGTAGPYATSLVIGAKGNPAVSFGDGCHYGNMMYG